MGLTLGALAGALLVKKPVYAGTIYDELKSLTQREEDRQDEGCCLLQGKH